MIFFFTFFFNAYKKEWREHKFWQQKNQKSILDRWIDVIKIHVSKKEAYGTKNSLKHFIGYNDNDVITPLCVRLLQMTGYAKSLMKMQQCPLELTKNIS